MRQGYIIDVPNVLLQYGDKQYVSLTATTGQVSVESDELTIQGGQQIYPLFTMNTQSTITVSFTDAQFNTDQLEAFGATAASENRTRYEMETSYEIGSDATITIEGRILTADDIKANGIQFVASDDPNVASSVPTGMAKVETSGEDTKITFNADMAGKTIQPVYSYQEKADSYKFLEGVFPKKAKVILQFPLYEDEDGNESKPNMVQITIYKASIQASPTIGGDYKSASTFEMTCTAMNPRRPDKEIWAIDTFEA